MMHSSKNAFIIISAWHKFWWKCELAFRELGNLAPRHIPSLLVSQHSLQNRAYQSHFSEEKRLRQVSQDGRLERGRACIQIEVYLVSNTLLLLLSYAGGRDKDPQARTGNHFPFRCQPCSDCPDSQMKNNFSPHQLLSGKKGHDKCSISATEVRATVAVVFLIVKQIQKDLTSFTAVFSSCPKYQ